MKNSQLQTLWRNVGLWRIPHFIIQHNSINNSGVISLCFQLWVAWHLSKADLLWQHVKLQYLTIYFTVQQTGLFTSTFYCFLSYFFAVWVNTMQTANLKAINKHIKMHSEHSIMFMRLQKTIKTFEINLVVWCFLQSLSWPRTQMNQKNRFEFNWDAIETTAVNHSARPLLWNFVFISVMMVVQMDQWCVLNGHLQLEVEIWHESSELQRFTLLDIW